MDFQASYTTAQNGLITFLYCTIVNSYIQGVNYIYNVTAKDPSGNEYTGQMQRSQGGEFIITQLTPV